MKIKSSVLTLAVAIAITGGAYVLTAPTAAAADLASNGAVVTPSGDATEDAKEAAHEANEAADEAKEEATEDRNDAIDDKYVPASGISAQVIYDKLTAAGYKEIDDIEFKDGIWEAEAKDPSGKEVEMKLDPNDGHIISTKKD